MYYRSIFCQTCQGMAKNHWINYCSVWNAENKPILWYVTTHQSKQSMICDIRWHISIQFCTATLYCNLNPTLGTRWRVITRFILWRIFFFHQVSQRPPQWEWSASWLYHCMKKCKNTLGGSSCSLNSAMMWKRARETETEKESERERVKSHQH